VSSRQLKLFAVVSVGFFVVQLDLFIVNIAFPDIERSFKGAGLATLSWALNGYAIIYAALLVAAGRFADRSGRRLVFLSGLALFTVSSALCAAAPSAGALIAARVLQAVGAALLTPASLALLLTEFPAHQRARAVGGWVAIGGVAAASGPSLGGLLTGVSWRLVFLVNVPVGLVGGIYALRLLRESRDENASGLPDLAGAGLLSLGIGTLVLALVEGPQWQWASVRTIACFVSAALLLATFLARSMRHPRPLVEPAMLRVRSFALANVTALFYMTAFSASLLAAVLYLTTVWHRSALLAGIAITPGPALVAVISPLAGRAATRVGQRHLICVGCLLFASGCTWWVWRMTPTAHYWQSFLPGWILCGIGVGLALPSMMSAGAGSLPKSRFATGSAVLTMSRQIGAALGVAMFVAVLGRPGTGDPTAAFDRSWVFMAIAACIAAASGLAIGKVYPHPEVEAPARCLDGEPPDPLARRRRAPAAAARGVGGSVVGRRG
jgi:EmrB/QacA subfamily drug resistance transporter